MPNRQPNTLGRQIPLPSTFFRCKSARIPLPAAWPNRIQALDTQWIFAVDKALFRGRNEFSPAGRGKLRRPQPWLEPAARCRDPFLSERSARPSVLRRQLIGLEHQPAGAPTVFDMRLQGFVVVL